MTSVSPIRSGGNPAHGVESISLTKDSRTVLIERHTGTSPKGVISIRDVTI